MGYLLSNFCHSELMGKPGKQASSHNIQSCDPFSLLIGTKPTKKPIAMLSLFDLSSLLCRYMWEDSFFMQISSRDNV